MPHTLPQAPGTWSSTHAHIPARTHARPRDETLPCHVWILTQTLHIRSASSTPGQERAWAATCASGDPSLIRASRDHKDQPIRPSLPRSSFRPPRDRFQEPLPSPQARSLLCASLTPLRLQLQDVQLVDNGRQQSHPHRDPRAHGERHRHWFHGGCVCGPALSILHQTIYAEEYGKR